MPDVWENTRSRWESVRHAVDGGGPGAGAAATASHARLGLSVNPIAVTGEEGAGKTALYDALTQAIRTGDRDSSRSPDIEKHAVDAIVDGQLAKRLRWLIVAVSKRDLYWDRLDEARDHYIPGRARRASPFAALMRDLEKETSLRLSVLPMAPRLIRHHYLPGLPVGTSQLDDVRIGVLRTHFGQELQTFITQRNGG